MMYPITPVQFTVFREKVVFSNKQTNQMKKYEGAAGVSSSGLPVLQQRLLLARKNIAPCNGFALEPSALLAPFLLCPSFRVSLHTLTTDFPACAATRFC